MTARKVKAVKAWAACPIGDGSGVLTLATIYETSRDARLDFSLKIARGDYIVIPVRITPLAKKKGKSNV